MRPPDKSGFPLRAVYKKCIFFLYHQSRSRCIVNVNTMVLVAFQCRYFSKQKLHGGPNVFAHDSKVLPGPAPCQRGWCQRGASCHLDPPVLLWPSRWARRWTGWAVSIIPPSRSIRPFRETRLSPAQISFLTAVEKASTGCLLWLKASVWSPNKPKAKALHRPSDISTWINNCGHLATAIFLAVCVGGRSGSSGAQVKMTWHKKKKETNKHRGLNVEAKFNFLITHYLFNLLIVLI